MSIESLMITHHYLFAGINQYLERHTNSPDIELEFDMGETEFHAQLTEYSRLLDKTHSNHKHDDAPGVFDYDFSSDLAANLFLCLLEHNGTQTPDLPKLKTFEKYTKLLMQDWYDKKVDGLTIVIDWLYTTQQGEK